jgi:hypothetical protein
MKASAAPRIGMWLMAGSWISCLVAVSWHILILQVISFDTSLSLSPTLSALNCPVAIYGVIVVFSAMLRGRKSSTGQLSRFLSRSLRSSRDDVNIQRQVLFSSFFLSLTPLLLYFLIFSKGQLFFCPLSIFLLLFQSFSISLSLLSSSSNYIFFTPLASLCIYLITFSFYISLSVLSNSLIRFTDWTSNDWTSKDRT